MLLDERLCDAVAHEHRRRLADGLRHCEFDLPRRGLMARWRARRAARSAAPAPAPAPVRAPERSAPPLVGIRRTMPDMYR
jgi:hypothetical protein